MSELALLGGKPIRTKSKWKSSPFGIEELKAVRRVIESGLLSKFRGGPEVKKFEQEFASYIDTQYAIATTSGTTALHTALSVLSLKEGSEVIVPALTFVSTASVVLQERLKPVFVDVDKTFCLDPKDLEKKITKKTKAIIPAHIYGHPSNMALITKIARCGDLFIIEDACQAHGAAVGNKKVGSIGNFGCFSFFQTKNMSCGEGGMVTTSDKSLYKAARLKREHGSPLDSPSWYFYQTLGYNYNMTEFQAAVGREQLRKLDQFNRRRIINAKKYIKVLENKGLSFIETRPGYKNVFHNLPVLLPLSLRKKRDFFVEALQAEGIPVGVAYPCPLYKTRLFIKAGVEANCPRAEEVASRIFNLFTDPTIDPSLINDTQKAIEKIFTFLKSEQN